MGRRCPVVTNQTVLNFYGWYLYVLIHHSLVMLTGLPVSSQPIHKVSQVVRLHGQTGSITGIGLCLRAWLLRSKKHFKFRLYILIDLFYNYIPLLI
jgi:hypothetical protein